MITNGERKKESIISDVLLLEDYRAARASEATYHTVELASFVTLRLSSTILSLPSAELAKVLGSPRNDIFEKFNLDPAQLFPCSTSQQVMLDHMAISSQG